MTETLFVRVKRIVSANINDVVDNMEKSQAEIVMKEAIREVEKATEEVRAELGKAMARGHHANNTSEITKKKVEIQNRKRSRKSVTEKIIIPKEN